MREMAGALWEGHTLLKTGLSAHRHTDRQTDRQTDKSYGTMRHVRSGKNTRCTGRGMTDRHPDRQTEWNDNKAHSLRK